MTAPKSNQLNGIETDLSQCHGTISISTGGPEFLSITSRVQDWLESIQAESGLITVFIRHTSASLTIQENADPDVLLDLKDKLARLAPEEYDYRHHSEGLDDMPAHIKAMLTSTMLNIPVKNGKILLGTWQGVYLIEHRARPQDRFLELYFLGIFSQ